MCIDSEAPINTSVMVHDLKNNLPVQKLWVMRAGPGLLLSVISAIMYTMPSCLTQDLMLPSVHLSIFGAKNYKLNDAHLEKSKIKTNDKNFIRVDIERGVVILT